MNLKNKKLTVGKNIPVYVIDWTDRYFHQSAFDVPLNLPSKKVTKYLRQFRKLGKIKLYRGIHKYNKNNREIISWTGDFNIAKKYADEEGGKVIEKEFPSKQVLLDTTLLNEVEKKQLGYDYKIDDKEVLIISKQLLRIYEL